MYNSIIHYLYIVLCVYHSKSSLLPSSIIAPLPSSTPPSPFPSDNHLTVVCAMNFFFFLLNPFTFSPSPCVLPSNSCQSILCIFVSLYLFLCIFFVYFVCQIPNISKIIWCLFFSDWLISLSIIPSKCIYATTNGKISFFLMTE